VALTVLGVAIGVLDVAVNAQAVVVERGYRGGYRGGGRVGILLIGRYGCATVGR
jgi:hypothetical protein